MCDQISKEILSNFAGVDFALVALKILKLERSFPALVGLAMHC